MHKDDNGDFIVSSDEMFILRQGLVTTKNHLDPAFSQDLHTLTGVTRGEFADLMKQVDELRRA
ncbi:hypothetical protein SAMN02982929_03748 [Saccharopolyspora kobensis]|uniref:Uncharacterized protein n=1 Tax=Saccharopolyspora kobensis TaxID=146035 RepID=A0A1H6CZV4_9PSEU|nr:hypothetical protein [Saccharopolyspora kobensis]SEG78397.1 hypothetical protein SAMN02982929_03748 [Saccharopolyspora kobensis]SFD05268.1 hypothetical protein SAMN05216506_102343 [Saccharopolyspora kobensis]